MAPYVRAVAKAPGEMQRVGIDFGDLLRANRLDPRTIGQYEVVTAVLSEGDEDHIEISDLARQGTEISCVVSGGELGEVYRITMRIYCAVGDETRWLERSIRLAVQDK